MKKKVLILYPFADDPQSVILCEELVKLGLKVIYLPFRSDDENWCDKGLYIDSDTIYYLGNDITDVKAVFIRALAFSVPSNQPAYLSRTEQAVWHAKYLQENIRFSSLFSMLEIFRQRGAIIVNHPYAYFQHNTKAQFFSSLFYQGCSVPELISTNDTDIAREFCRKGPCVCKSSYGIGATRTVKSESLADGCGLDKTPAIFQKQVKGDTIRVHTVGTKVVLSLKILSEGIDSRTNTAGFEVFSLPERLQDEIRRINMKYESYYSAWDAIVENENECYLLDFNPGPYIGWIGSYFTRYVMSALALFISLHSEGVSVESTSAALTLPELRFNKVAVDHSGLRHDYVDLYKRGLRIRL